MLKATLYTLTTTAAGLGACWALWALGCGLLALLVPYAAWATLDRLLTVDD